MSRPIGAVAGVMLVLVLWASPQNNRFLRYKTVEAYEIRPGILMIPRYSDYGGVCEVGVERKHYLSEVVRLDPDMDREVIDQVFDELVPTDERGPRTKNMGGRDLISQNGNSLIRYSEYENVSIRVYSDDSRTCRRANVVAVIQWKNRQCR